jgi:hypothetical protein
MWTAVVDMFLAQQLSQIFRYVTRFLSARLASYAKKTASAPSSSSAVRWLLLATYWYFVGSLEHIS